MALLWQHTKNGTNYEVRSAGQTRRLYTNGVFHSQYNPDRPVTGNVWDLLLLPAYFRDPNSIKRVLVLGVGGGAVIQLLRRYVAPENIVGVELDPIHLSIARRFFGVKGRDVELIEADAIEWLSDYQGEQFDLVIDDLFSDTDGDPQRAVPVNRQWIKQLDKVLSKSGVLAINFVSGKELKRSMNDTQALLKKQFTSVFGIKTCQNHNTIGIFTRQAATSEQLRTRLAAVPALNPRRKSAQLQYSIRQIV